MSNATLSENPLVLWLRRWRCRFTAHDFAVIPDHYGLECRRCGKVVAV